ncbi:MAG TPA: hypothetical protein VL403_07290, partial [Candidatus Kryptonia bacterium]|nr:hypothetical protein [Candidatus Kryptonia bacterium]
MSPPAERGDRFKARRRGLRVARHLSALIVPALVGFAWPAFATCVGDCDHNGRVTVEELVTGVNIALGNAAVGTCPAFDADNNQHVTIDELVTAVNSALNGCPAEPSATPTPTPTPPNTVTPTGLISPTPSTTAALVIAF